MSGDPSDFAPQDLKALWQGQAQELQPMSLAEIHQKARKLERGVRWRNIREYVASVIVVACFAPLLLHRESWMMQAGAALIIVATVFVAWQIHKRTATGATPEAGEAVRDFHRQTLIRQRDALRSVGGWYIAPFAPGMILLMLGRWFQAHTVGRSLAMDHLAILLGGGIVALILGLVWGLNQWGARRLQKQIDQL